jgi:predicted  nucleic acid-binding Zn-ribbon protein
MFYRCPKCGKMFKSGLDTITEREFGRCPECGAEGTLVAESGKTYPPDPERYADTAL